MRLDPLGDSDEIQATPLFLRFNEEELLRGVAVSSLRFLDFNELEDAERGSQMLWSGIVSVDTDSGGVSASNAVEGESGLECLAATFSSSSWSSDS